MGRLERHIVGEASRLPAQAPQRRGHPSRGGRHERLGLPAEFRPTRIPDRMDREAWAPTLRDVLRQIDDELRLLPEHPFEVSIQVVAVQVMFRDRDEDGVPPSPGVPSAERDVLLPRGEREKRVPLVAACLIRLGGHEKSHGVRKDSAAKVFPLAARAQPLCVPLRYSGRSPWSRSPSFPRCKDIRKAASRRSSSGFGPITPSGRWKIGPSRKLYEISRPLIPRG